MEYLTLYPDSALKIPEYLLSKKLNSNQQITLVHALERVGTPEAQTSLSRIMNGEKFSKESRTQAAIGLGSIEKPTDGALKSLWQAYENRSGGEENAGHIAATAVLSLGALAKELGHSPAPGYRETSRSIKDKIASDLASDQDLNTKVALLHAAGNTADKDLVAGITSYFNDDNPRVRSAAVNSLVYMDDSVVNKILTKELDSQDDINVRNSIVTTMYRKEATEESVDTIIEKIPNEENDIVRGEMYRYLLKNRDLPEVKDALKIMLEKERSAEHRKIIRTALSTKKKASGNKG
jgi:HEAT repeat protein